MSETAEAELRVFSYSSGHYSLVARPNNSVLLKRNEDPVHTPALPFSISCGTVRSSQLVPETGCSRSNDSEDEAGTCFTHLWEVRSFSRSLPGGEGYRGGIPGQFRNLGGCSNVLATMIQQGTLKNLKTIDGTSGYKVHRQRSMTGLLNGTFRDIL